MSQSSENPRRRLPAVDRVLNRPEAAGLCARHGRRVVAGWVRDILDGMRNGEAPDVFPDEPAAMLSEVLERLARAAHVEQAQSLRRVINGTGIVLHTNLGRAPLAQAAIDAMVECAAYANLELDLLTGRRGQRAAAVERLCAEVAGAEAALVVNNCAAATLLTLQTIAAGRRVVISRGQLVEIGGSYRLPDVFRQAGVVLHEVGTTNRTRLADYASAICHETAAILRVHPSNYRIAGFCESVSIAELAELGKARGLAVIDDLGSGCLYDLTRFGLLDEPIVAASVQAGADLALFSGDKLLGGPQCGIIVGRESLVDGLRANPLARAFRVDKLTLAALQATLEIHRAGRAFEEIPVLRQLSYPLDAIRARTETLVARLRSASSATHAISVEAVESATGGGALPAQAIASSAIAISGSNPDQLAARLRLGSPAVVPRSHDGRVLIDLRTVFPDDDEILAERILESLTK